MSGAQTLRLKWPWLWRSSADRAAHIAERAAESGGGDDQEAPFETIYVAGSMLQAELLKARLDSEGIPVLLRYETWRLLQTPSLSNIEVQVPRLLAERARELLLV
jgi:hypothetical protein